MNIRAAPHEDRPTIAASVDRQLLAAIDGCIRDLPGLDRDAVIDAALRLWLARAQTDAMEAQFAGSLDDDVDPDEWASWSSIRRAAAARLFERDPVE